MAEERHLHRGTPGASALLKAQRLREERESVSARRSGLGRFLAAVFPSEQEKRLRSNERNWTVGGHAEETLASSLARRCPNVPMLHDQRAPMSLGNIDHIAFAASGVYVIDCKCYVGKVEVAEPLFGNAKLKINGRDQTKLLEGLDKQVAQVKAAVADSASDVPVHGCLCFVQDNGLPLLRTLKIRGYSLHSPRRLAKQLERPGPITADRALGLQASLAQRLHSSAPDRPA